MLTNCYVGAESGALKAIDYTKSQIQNVNVVDVKSLNAKTDAITAMCFVAAGTDERVLTCHADRQLRIYNEADEVSQELFSASGGDGPIKGIQIAANTTRIVTGVESGEISVWDANNWEAVERNCLTNWSSGAHLFAICSNPEDDNLLASGGVENPLKVWDLTSQTAVFTAKNVRHDSLELRVPIWETNMRFLRENSQCVVTTTGKYHIRLYDRRVQRRPVAEIQWLESPLYALSTCCRNNQILAGNSRGELGLFDLRNNKVSLMCKFRGFSGSIRCIDAHPTEPIFASCGIDRYMIVHNIDTRAILKKVFCKVQLNSVLLCHRVNDDKELVKKSERGVKRRRPKQGVEGNDNDDDSWDGIFEK